MKRLAILLATISTPAFASANPTQDTRDLSAAALCGPTNVACKQSYLNGSKDASAPVKRVRATYQPMWDERAQLTAAADARIADLSAKLNTELTRVGLLQNDLGKAVRERDDALAALAACKVAPGCYVAAPPPAPAPAPTPAPTPSPALSGVVSEGDSISVFWGGNHVGLYASSRPDITVKGLAVGGSGLNNLIARRQAVLDLKPKVFTVLIGANDLSSYATGNAYCAAVLAYIGPVRALGSKVAVGTILPQSLAGFNAKRLEANACFRAAVGSTIDGVYDFDTVTIPLQADGVHPTDAGQAVMAPVYKRTVDGLLSGAPAPVPPPSPPPAPPPVDTTLHPLAFVPSPDVDINTELVPAWGNGAIPAKGFTGATPNLDDPGAFRFVCAPAGLNYDDPIVYPNQPGKSHLHQYYGNTAINAASTYASIRTTGASTCNSPLNRSGYWEPAMLTGTGQVVRPDYNTLYYKAYPTTHAFCTKGNRLYQGECVAIPNGLRMIFGFNMQTMTGGTGYYNCQGPTATQAHYPASQNGLRTAAAACGSGNRLGMIISAPRCWDGVHLDTPDHRSHLAYMTRDPNTGLEACDAAHPKVIPELTLGVWYSVGPETANGWYLSSDVMEDGSTMTPGSTFHADYFEGWDERVKAMWMAGCIEQRLNCSGGDLGTSKQLRMFAGFTMTANPRLVPVPVKP